MVKGLIPGLCRGRPFRQRADTRGAEDFPVLQFFLPTLEVGAVFPGRQQFLEREALIKAILRGSGKRPVPVDGPNRFQIDLMARAVTQAHPRFRGLLHVPLQGPNPEANAVGRHTCGIAVELTQALIIPVRHGDALLWMRVLRRPARCPAFLDSHRFEPVRSYRNEPGRRLS